MSAGAVQAMVETIGKEFERLSGHRLDLNFGTAGALRARFAGGETADLLILPAAIIAALDQDGRLAAGSIRDLGRTVTEIGRASCRERVEVSEVGGSRGTEEESGG